MKIYAWGFMGERDCVISDSFEDSWNRISQDMRNYLIEPDINYCEVIDVKDGVFHAYDIWEAE
jgi:hypothetical protein